MSTLLETGTVLDKILAKTARDVAIRKSTTPVTILECRGADRPLPLRLARALEGPDIGVIAEIKRASPSRGVFPVSVDPPAIAERYIAGGADALSVLTDEPFFHGSLADLDAASRVAHGADTPVPVLRKDFMLDPYQIVEAYAYGADVILLIVGALGDELLAMLYRESIRLGLSVLVEVHDAGELKRALAVGAEIIGVNNRDLRSFVVDLATTERLAEHIPAGVQLVSESGIFSRADVERMERAGASAVLVGESLIVQDDRAAAVRSLLAPVGEIRG